MASLVAQDSALVKCRKHHEMECFFVNTIRRSPDTTIGYSLKVGDGAQLPVIAADSRSPSQPAKHWDYWSFGPRWPGGMTISWRPKKRASRE